MAQVLIYGDDPASRDGWPSKRRHLFILIPMRLIMDPGKTVSAERLQDCFDNNRKWLKIRRYPPGFGLVCFDFPQVLYGFIAVDLWRYEGVWSGNRSLEMIGMGVLMRLEVPQT